MRKRGMIGLVAISAAFLAYGKAFTWAQKPPLAAMFPTTSEPKGWKTSEPKAMPGNDDLLPQPAENAAGLASGNDPMTAVESFLDRNRKEADQSIQALSGEAEALRARLQKVEAALARWQEVARALNPQPAPQPAAIVSSPQDSDPAPTLTVPGPEPTPAPAVSVPPPSQATPTLPTPSETPAPPAIPTDPIPRTGPTT